MCARASGGGAVNMDLTRIDQRAREIRANNGPNELGTRTRGAVIAYFDGEDLTGKIHRNINTYAAFLAILTGTGVSGFKQRQQKNSETLIEELNDTFKQVGFTSPEGELRVPGRDNYDNITGSIGPLMPGILAVLEIEHGIDSTEAVRQYRPNSLKVILPAEDQESGVHGSPERDWETIIRDASGFSTDADAYVYVLELNRLSDSSTWFYVGKKEGTFEDLLSYLRSHANKFTRSRAIIYEGHEILLGDYNTSVAPQGTTHHVVDVERVVPIRVPELSALDDSGAQTHYISEIERRTAYEVAIEHQTTNVLGGK